MSQFDKLAKAYTNACKSLAKAEVLHRENLDRLDAALQAKQAHHVTLLRRDCAKTEGDCIAALDDALNAHRQYWTARRDALKPELDAAALVLAEFDALAKLAGDRSAHPAKAYLEGRAIAGFSGANVLAQDVLATDGVPTEEPDSALLEDFRGSWRGSSRA